MLLVHHLAPWSHLCPGPLLDYRDPTWSTSCNYTPEIADQGRSWWTRGTRGTRGTMELGVGPGAPWSHFDILLIYYPNPKANGGCCFIVPVGLCTKVG